MCPECKEPMVAFEFNGVEIDRCVACGGTWLDTGELETITELAGVAPGALSEAIRSARRGPKAKRRCPRCARKLEVITVGRKATVELDRCPSGHGLWLDRGETVAVIESFSDGEEGLVARFLSDLFHDERNSKALGE